MIDRSTLSKAKLDQADCYSLPATYSLQRGMGNGCFLDPPGYPTYFTRAVYTIRGDLLILPGSVHYVFDNPDGSPFVALRDGDNWEKLEQFWAQLPIEHPRVQAWMKDVYRHLHHCYHDEEANDKTLVYPVPYYKLPVKKYTLTVDLDAPISTFTNEIKRIKAEREEEAKRIEAHAAALATPDNHKAVRLIRRFYPEHQPRLDWIESPPASTGDWWTICDAPPQSAEECNEILRVRYGASKDWRHPIGGSRCQFCGWTEAGGFQEVPGE